MILHTVKINMHRDRQSYRLYTLEEGQIRAIAIHQFYWMRIEKIKNFLTLIELIPLKLLLEQVEQVALRFRSSSIRCKCSRWISLSSR